MTGLFDWQNLKVPSEKSDGNYCGRAGWSGDWVTGARRLKGHRKSTHVSGGNAFTFGWPIHSKLVALVPDF